MPGYNSRPKTRAGKIGKQIYENALCDRRGFRPDQIGIPDEDEIWQEIFQAMGEFALHAVNTITK